jgi:type II secretory pathway predicted ATPase ExeA
MNPSFFGLEGHPFERAKQGGDAFLSDAHRALMAELHAGLKAPHGITLLIGDEGSGKSTLARAFALELADSATVAYLPTTGPGLRHLLTETIEQLGGTDSAATDEQALLDELSRLARARAEHDRITLIILDDAHELPAKTIERLGKLFGDDPAEPSMLHIILVGRGELLDRMNAANDRSILKHLVQVCRMDPIGPEESFRYIADRITKVGGVVDSLFTEDALHMIVKRANGFPARIDAICTASLDFAEGRGDSNVGTQIVDLACSGADDFAVGEPESPTGASSYFLADDSEGEAEQEAMSEPQIDRPSTSAAAPRPSDPSTNGGRRRLAVWAVGLIGVVGLFAATMSGTGPDDDLSGLGSGQDGEQLAALLPDDEGEGDGAVAGDPIAAPKLHMKKAGGKGSAAPVIASAKSEQRDRKKQILDTLQETAEPQRATAPVHASPSKAASEGVRPPSDAPSAAAVVAKADAEGRAKASVDPAERASDKMQPVATRARVQTPTHTPSRKVQAAEAAGAQTAAASPAETAAAPAKAAPAPEGPAPAPARAATAAVVVPPPPAPRAPVAAAKTTPRPAAPPKRVASAPKPAPRAPAVPSKYFTVQLGAFGSRANAEALLAKVRPKYSDARIIATTASGKPVFRVVSGTFTAMQDAKGRASSLAKSGFATYVRAVGP